jgi:hypothetical protein
MAYIPTSEIKIKDITLRGVNTLKINRSVRTLVDKAIITVPTTAILKKLEDNSKTKVETVKQIDRGDKVEISLGYNGELKRDFVGFVSEIKHKQPAEIHCIDYFYLLQHKTIQKSYKKTTLKEVLTDLLQGLDGVTVDSKTVSMNIKNLQLNNDGNAITRAKALQRIKQRYGLTIYFDLDGNLYAGLLAGKKGAKVKHRLGWNVSNVRNLEYKKAGDIKLKIRAVSVQPDGSRLEIEVGDDSGDERTLYFNDISSESELEQLAEQEIKKHKYDGYNGKIETLLVPFAAPAMVSELQDPQFGDRAGSYFIESTETSLSTSRGGKRLIEIGSKL